MADKNTQPEKVYGNEAHRLKMLCEVFVREAKRISPGVEVDVTLSNLPVHTVLGHLLTLTDNPDKYIQELFPGYCNYEGKAKLGDGNQVKLESEYFYIT